MKIIDRYLLRQFAHVFVICFVSLTGLYVMLDAFSHLDDFMRLPKRREPARRAERVLFLQIDRLLRATGVV